MASRPPSSENSRNSDLESIDIEQGLRDIEQALLVLKARYAQVQMDQQRQQALRERLSEVEQELKRERSRTLQAEVKRIKQQLDEIEVALESQLFSWVGLKEVFWQAVRFGGLGIILGWLLKTWAE